VVFWPQSSRICSVFESINIDFIAVCRHLPGRVATQRSYSILVYSQMVSTGDSVHKFQQLLNTRTVGHINKTQLNTIQFPGDFAIFPVDFREYYTPRYYYYSLLLTTNYTHRSMQHLFRCYLLLMFFRTADKTCQAVCCEDLTSEGALLPFAMCRDRNISQLWITPLQRTSGFLV